MSTYIRSFIFLPCKAVFDITRMNITHFVKVGIKFYRTPIRDIPYNIEDFTSGTVAYTKYEVPLKYVSNKVYLYSLALQPCNIT